MTALYVDVSHWDRDRRGAPLDWHAIAMAGLGGVMCARATYGDPAVYAPTTRYFGEHVDGTRAAGYTMPGGYHNLIRGDQASIVRQVDWLRSELDAHECTWAMCDVEPYEALRLNGLWPRWQDVQRFHDTWHNVDPRTLAWYIGKWVWSGWLGSPDLTALQGPLISANYPGGVGTAQAIYTASGDAGGPGWAPYGGRTPDLWQFTSKAAVPGASVTTDVNAHRGTLGELVALLGGGVMTFAPATLRAARTLLLNRLDMHPLSGAFPGDLDPAEVGIVGDSSHVTFGTSYHLGKDALLSNAYSRRTARDIAGLSNAASAEDVGEFSVTTARGTFTHRNLATWSVAQCQANHPDTRDIREVIYSPDGVRVFGYDRERGVASAPVERTPDNHRFHDHYSIYRDAEFRYSLRDHFARWLGEIDMPLLPADVDLIYNEPEPLSASTLVTGEAIPASAHPARTRQAYAHLHSYASRRVAEAVYADVKAALAKLDLIASKVDIDPDELAAVGTAAAAGAQAGVLASADALAAAIKAALPPGNLTPDDVEAAVRRAFAGGLAPEV